MNRAFTKILVLALLVVTSFSACKKDDDDSLAVTKENMVGTYTMTSLVIKISGFPDVDGMKDMDACEKDDQIILKADLTAEYKDAGTVCNPAGGGTGPWSITGSTIDIDGEDFTVKSLTKTKLVLEQSGTINGAAATATTTFSKK